MRVDAVGSSDPATVTWRTDLDALQFDLADGAGQCLIHRLAFRTLMAGPPSPDECLAYFHENRSALEAAARAKIQHAALPAGARFHLTSRDIARAVAAPGA